MAIYWKLKTPLIIGSTAESLVESAQSLFKSLVPQNPNDKIFEDVAIYNTDGSITLKQNISKEALLTSMRNGIISEYKRFLTQETGNGISEGDVKRIDDLLGKPGAFKNIAEVCLCTARNFLWYRKQGR